MEWLGAGRMRMILISLLSLLESVLTGEIVPVFPASPKFFLDSGKRRDLLCNRCDNSTSGFMVNVIFCKIYEFLLSFRKEKPRSGNEKG